MKPCMMYVHWRSRNLLAHPLTLHGIVADVRWLDVCVLLNNSHVWMILNDLMWILNVHTYLMHIGIVSCVMCYVCSSKRCLKCYDVLSVLSIHPYLIVIRDVAFDQMCCVTVAVRVACL